MQNPLTRFDLNLLVALDALLSERHVTHAAERLYVSQPAMSGMLQRLREQFDDALLVRVGREMEVTPKGRVLKERVQEALRILRDLLESQLSFDPATGHRSFRIVMSDYCTEVFLPALLRRLSVQAPSLQIWTENIGYDSYERLASGEVDLCIATDDERLMAHGRRTYGFRSAFLFADEYVCVFSADHPLVGPELTLETFKACHHARTKFSSTTVTVEENAFRDAQMDLQVRVLIPSFSSVFRLLPGTDMIATVQRRIADLYVPTLPLRMSAPPLRIPALQEALVWHPRNEADPAHAWLRAACVEVAAQLS